MKKEYGKKLLKGRFYWHQDGSKKRFHPTLIYKKNDDKNLYYIVCFTSSKGRGRRKLFENTHPTSNEECYVLNNPRCAKRKSFGSQLPSFRVCNKRDKITIKRIQKKK